MLSVLVESFYPLPKHLSLSLPSSATAADVIHGFRLALPGSTSFSIAQHGCRVSDSTRLQSLGSTGSPIMLQVRVAMPGGKGGFGAMLRSQGGKMSSGARKSNNDSCRDLNGRRLGVVKEAKKLAEYLEGESERQKQMDEAQQKKYAKLERMLGRTPKTEKDLAEAADKMADAGQDFDDANASPEPSSRHVSDATRSEPVAGTKRKERIEDSQYVEQSREIVENVRSAVATAMMKKKKTKLGKTKSAASTSGTKVPAST